MNNGESLSRKPEYPGTLDVVDWNVNGREYQINFSTQSGDPVTDFFGVTDTSTGKFSGRINRATFRPYFPTLNPTGQFVAKRDEGVRKTGQLRGGEME